MLLRRHRASLPDVDPAFNKTPHETVDPAFNDPNLASNEPEEQVETSSEPINPADFTVDQAIEYLETATPEDREAILEQERAGKARKGILEWSAPAEDLF